MVIISWNCRGIRNKKDCLKLMIRDYDPEAILLQETKLKVDEKIEFRGYDTFLVSIETSGNARGGVAVLAKSSLCPEEIDIQDGIGNIQAVAVRLGLSRAFTVCSIYMQASDRVSAEELGKLVSNVGDTTLFSGDFNAHHERWGHTRNDRLGELVNEKIESTEFELLNQTDFTYVDARSGIPSTLDLSFCTRTLRGYFTWQVLYDVLSSSDHLPVMIGWGQGRRFSFPEEIRYNSAKADWGAFSRLTQCEIETMDFDAQTVLPEYERFVRLIEEAASQSMPMSKGGSYRYNVPWWTMEIKNAIKHRKRMLRKFRLNPDSLNNDNVK